MVWTPPKTWLTGEVLSSVDMNLYVGDNTAFLKNVLDGGYLFYTRRIYTSSTTVDIDDLLGDGTDTSFLRAAHVVMVAGGGGGGAGGASNAVGSGGGAGELEEAIWWDLSSWRPTLTVTIGEGGAGGTSGAGTDGGNTLLAGTSGTLMSAAGGNFGTQSPLSQAVDMRGTKGGTGGGSASVSSTSARTIVSVPGESGHYAISVITTDDATGVQFGGHGGNSRFGRGGRGGYNTLSPPGKPDSAAGWGAGGGGGTNSEAGGDGADGLVMIDFYR